MKPERQSRSVGLYPNCHAVARTVRLGGMSKSELLAELQSNGIQLNEYGRSLFANSKLI